MIYEIKRRQTPPIMKKNILPLLLGTLLLSASTTQGQNKKVEEKKKQEDSEIIILKKGDKNSKTIIEIKDGEVFVNGKKSDGKDLGNDSVKVKINLREGKTLFSVPGIRIDNLEMEPTDEVIQNGGSKAFLGVSTEAAPESGARIVSVSDNSAAKKAGLQNGDVIIGVDDHKIGSPAELVETIPQYKPFTDVTIHFMRDDKKMSVKTNLGEARNTTMIRRNFRSIPFNGENGIPNEKELEKIIEGSLDSSFKVFNFKNGKNFDFDFKPEFDFNPRPKIGLKVQDLEEGKGAKILEVTKDSPAEKAGLKIGDIITEFDGKKIEEADDMVASLKSAADKFSMPVIIKRDGKSQNLTVKIPKKLKTANL